MKKVTQRSGQAQVGVQKVDAKAIFEKHDEYRTYARSQVLSAWPQILQGLIEKAIGGGYQHTKLLLDLCQLAVEEPPRADGHPKDQLCDALLDNLLLRRPE